MLFPLPPKNGLIINAGVGGKMQIWFYLCDLPLKFKKKLVKIFETWKF